MELNVSGAEARANRIWVFINPLKPSVQWSLHLTHTCTHTLSLCSVVTFLHSQSDVLWWHQAEPWDLRLSRCVWVEPKSTPRKNWPKFWQPFKQEPKNWYGWFSVTIQTFTLFYHLQLLLEHFQCCCLYPTIWGYRHIHTSLPNIVAWGGAFNLGGKKLWHRASEVGKFKISIL